MDQICYGCGRTLKYYDSPQRCPVCDIPMRPFSEDDNSLFGVVCNTCGKSFSTDEDMMSHYCDEGKWEA